MYPVKIASLDEISVGDNILLAGFGKLGQDKQNWAMNLRQVRVKVKEINQAMRSFDIEQGTQHGACEGDSGGPAFVDNGQELKVVGATHGAGTGANGPCDVGHGLYSIVSLYQGWMKCAFSSHNNPLNSLVNDASSAECLN